jgi:2,3-bisphosphoglycerate-dependent phosphoglycerate mutase
MYKLVLLRHGQTIYNKEKKFCGWTDVDLTEQGLEEAHEAGKSLKKAGFVFDQGFCSMLTRSIETLNIVLFEMGQQKLPVEFTWRLNERHYGALQGRTHEDMAKETSPEQVQRWRRSFDERPPQLTEADPRHPCKNEKYCDIEPSDLPCGESLKDTIARVLPYWDSNIEPAIRAGRQVIVGASGNSLRALIKHLDNISNEAIVGLEIKTGTPLVFELDENMRGIGKYYLGKEGVKEEV